MNPICQTDCCLSCPRKDACPGCAETNGHPFGGNCYAAEAIKRGKSLAAIKAALCDEINALAIPGVTVSELYLLSGVFRAGKRQSFFGTKTSISARRSSVRTAGTSA